MDSSHRQDLKGRDAFWTPKLSLVSPRYANGYDAERILRSGRSAVGPERRLASLRGCVGALVEYLCLASALLAAVFPKSSVGSPRPTLHAGIKRATDLAGATLGLVVTLPIFIVIPLLIKLDTPGPVFYRQTRVGVNRRRHGRRILRVATTSDRRGRERRRRDESGRVFKLIKFRSMVDHAERSCGPVWATSNDPRVTRLGGFLRRSRIDELPQLINVLRGQMSLVGPRPERPHFVSRFCGNIDNYHFRHRVKPGITGLAQIENGYDRCEEDVRRKIEYDLAYIRSWSPALDLQILLRTVRVIVSGRGAR